MVLAAAGVVATRGARPNVRAGGAPKWRRTCWVANACLSVDETPGVADKPGVKAHHLTRIQTGAVGDAAPSSLEDRIAETVAAAVARAIEPLRVNLERVLAAQGPQLLTIPEFAERVRRSVRTVERWIKEGTVDAVRVGEVWMVRLPAGR